MTTNTWVDPEGGGGGGDRSGPPPPPPTPEIARLLAFHFAMLKFSITPLLGIQTKCPLDEMTFGRNVLLRMFAANEKVFKLFFLPLFFDSKIQHKTFENKINIG